MISIQYNDNDDKYIHTLWNSSHPFIRFIREYIGTVKK